MSRRKRDRSRPLSDPGRAPYARAALDRKQRRREREALAALGDDPKRHARALAHLSECLAIIDRVGE